MTQKPETATAPQDSRRTEPAKEGTASRARGQALPIRGRVRYKYAGAAQRQAHTRAVERGATDFQLRVLLAVFYLTTSYSKLTDRTSARQIAAIVFGVDPERVAGWARKRVSSALKGLYDRGVLLYERTVGATWLIVSVPPDNTAGEPYPESGDGQTGQHQASPPLHQPSPKSATQPSPRNGPHLEVPRSNPRDGSQRRKSDGLDSSRDTFTPERAKPSATKKSEGVDDVRGFFDVVREHVGIELEPTRALVHEIRARMAQGYSARHVGGEVDARSWPAELDSPEAMAIFRLRRLEDTP